MLLLTGAVAPAAGALLASTMVLVVAVLFVFAAILGGMLYGMLVVMKKGSQEAVDDALDPLRRKVSDLLETAEGLKTRLERMTTGDAPEPEGATKPLVEAAQAELDAVWDEWLAVQSALDSARAKAEDAPEMAAGAEVRLAAEREARGAEERFERAMKRAEALEPKLRELEEAPVRGAMAIDACRMGLDALAGHAGSRAEVERIRGALAAFDVRPWPDPIGVARQAAALLQEARAAAATAGVAWPKGATAASGGMDPLPEGDGDDGGGASRAREAEPA